MYLFFKFLQIAFISNSKSIFHLISIFFLDFTFVRAFTMHDNNFNYSKLKNRYILNNKKKKKKKKKKKSVEI